MNGTKKCLGRHNPGIEALNERKTIVSRSSVNNLTLSESDCQERVPQLDNGKQVNPPGWLVRAATRPALAGGPTSKQLATLTSLLRQVGKPKYWEVKELLGIRRTLPMTQLTRRQAGDLIGELIAVVEGGRR